MSIYYETEEERNALQQLADAALKIGGIQNLQSVNNFLSLLKKHECNKEINQ